MSIHPISPASRAYNQPRGFNSYHRAKHKITALPPDVSLDKPKKKTWSELLSPWILNNVARCLIIVGVLVVIALLNGMIGE